VLSLLLLLSGVTVTLRESAAVRGAEIELADVAEVAGDDAELVARVRAVSLGWSPAPGFSRWLDAQRVKLELERSAPGAVLELRGANGCRAWPQVERVRGETIEAAARGQIARWLAGRDAELALQAHVADIDVPSGERGNELRATAKQVDLRSGAINVPVEVLIDGALHRTVWTSWSVDLWETCAVPVRAIESGETIAADLLETKRVRARDGVPATALELIGSVATRDLPAGEPILAAQTSRPTLISRGDALALEIRRGVVAARVGVVAEQPGKQGERIRVAQPGTQRTWLATVVARDLVVIDLETK
jgi:flagella basal body P-ring formation protein FlgA